MVVHPIRKEYKWKLHEMGAWLTILGLGRGMGLGCRGLMMEEAGLLGLVNGCCLQ